MHDRKVSTDRALLFHWYMEHFRQDVGLNEIDDEQEYIITKLLEQIIKELDLEIFAYNICNDHIHIILISEEKELSTII